MRDCSKILGCLVFLLDGRGLHPRHSENDLWKVMMTGLDVPQHRFLQECEHHLLEAHGFGPDLVMASIYQ
jgi:hypothetical protein